ncbi:long-chain-fatty-acid--CoA ligase, partial [Lysobacter sp. 2RAB21]
VKILGKDGEELQKGEVGEVALYTESRAKGYYNLPGELEKRLSQSYYLTGDLGEMRLDGKVYIKGRKSDVVDVAGKKV